MTSLALQLAVEESKVTPGLLGFLVVASLGILTWLLLKSMNKRLKGVNFEEEPPAPRPGRPGGGGAAKKDTGAPVG